MSSQAISPNTEAAILGRLMQARDRSMSRDVAEYLLSIAFDEDDTGRMNALAERAREGNLTTEEAVEIDSYLHVGSLLSILQSKARRLLKSEGRQHGGTATLDNLAVACFHCNRFKGPNIAGLDPTSGELVRLFHPRTRPLDGTLPIRRPPACGHNAHRPRDNSRSCVERG